MRQGKEGVGLGEGVKITHSQAQNSSCQPGKENPTQDYLCVLIPLEFLGLVSLGWYCLRYLGCDLKTARQALRCFLLESLRWEVIGPLVMNDG